MTFRRRFRRLESLIGDNSPSPRKAPAPRPLKTAQDVIDLLHEQIEAVRAEPWASTLEKARAIGYLAGLARKAIETGTLAARVEMLEAVLKRRQGGQER